MLPYSQAIVFNPRLKLDVRLNMNAQVNSARNNDGVPIANPLNRLGFGSMIKTNYKVFFLADGPPRDGRARHAGSADIIVDDHARADGRGRAAAPPAARLRGHEPRHEPPPPRGRARACPACTPRPPRRRATSRHRHRPART